jgi:hypothetical protein
MSNLKSRISHPVRSLAAWPMIAGGLVFVAGCASEPESHVVSAPPPPPPGTQVVVAQVQPTQVVVASPVQSGNGTVIVMQAPPALQQEVVLAQPTSDHKWVGGYWTWRNARYEWLAGHWELPPSSSSTWVVPRWERTGNGGYRFYEGYWS